MGCGVIIWTYLPSFHEIEDILDANDELCLIVER